MLSNAAFLIYVNLRSYIRELFKHKQFYLGIFNKRELLSVLT